MHVIISLPEWRREVGGGAREGGICRGGIWGAKIWNLGVCIAMC